MMSSLSANARRGTVDPMAKKRATAERKPNRYSAIIGTIFKNHYKPGKTQFAFSRDEFVGIAKSLGIVLPKNLGDTIYSFRFRTALPAEIVATATRGMEWGIELAGKGEYRFKLGKFVRIVPRSDLIAIKIPDATPEIITAYALTHEQSLLAKVRYNRLIDIFLGIASYSLQNHLQTFVKNMGQIEIDEVYVGLDRNGQQFVIPVQAKGGTDQLGVTQTRQDIECCLQKFPNLTCRPISAQFMTDDTIALFELALQGEDVKIFEEKHYKLVPSDQIGADDLKLYANR
jgi:hypothetical protein